MQKLDKVGDFVWVSMLEPICEIGGKFCRFNISYLNGPGTCCYRTVWAYDTLVDAARNSDKGKADSRHSWDTWDQLKILDGAFGSPSYVKAVVEVCTAFDEKRVQSLYYPYRWETRRSNGRIGIRLKALPAANQTSEGAILSMICGV